MWEQHSLHTYGVQFRSITHTWMLRPQNGNFYYIANWTSDRCVNHKMACQLYALLIQNPSNASQEKVYSLFVRNTYIHDARGSTLTEITSRRQ